MHEVLNRNLYFVKEHIGLFKAANNYDILDPTTGQVILECREPKLGPFTKLFRSPTSRGRPRSTYGFRRRPGSRSSA